MRFGAGAAWPRPEFARVFRGGQASGAGNNHHRLGARSLLEHLVEINDVVVEQLWHSQLLGNAVDNATDQMFGDEGRQIRDAQRQQDPDLVAGLHLKADEGSRQLVGPQSQLGIAHALGGKTMASPSGCSTTARSRLSPMVATAMTPALLGQILLERVVKPPHAGFLVAR